MAKLFNQKPSDVALLDDCLGEFALYWFDRAIAAFGRGVHVRLEQAGQSSNPVIARSQREREWERLMGGDMEQSAAGFADVDVSAASGNVRVIGRDDEQDEEIALDGGW